MNIIFPLAILAVLLAGGFLVAFLLALHNGQFDDSQTPSRRILLDNESENLSQHSSTHPSHLKSQKEK